MQEIYTEQVRTVIKNKKRLEQELDIKITNKGKLIFVDGEADKEFIAIQAIEAINLNFSVEKALFLKNPEIILQRINIKDITKRQDLERIRARIIGTGGKTLKTLNNLTNCEFSLEDNSIGIIGAIEYIEDAKQSIISLIKGSKQSNVYARVERQRRGKRLE